MDGARGKKMREILFRGKRIDNGEWVYGSLILWKCGDAEICVSSTEEREEQSKVIVHPETVSQYTGLTDKNGKKIFEGDIVAQNWYDHDEPSDDSFGEVVFCEYDCSFSVMDIQKDGIAPLGRCHAYRWEAEVIGNIHDNPELLEVTDNA
jgi:uncharacterized phage protein (TIGR01671 family)